MSLTQHNNIDRCLHHSRIHGLTCIALRTLQFTLAITIAGLYGVDLANSTKSNSPADSEWIYAETAACLSAITSIVHCFAGATHVGWYTWDFVLFVLWMAQTGVFGNIYLSPNVRDGYMKATSSIDRMKAGIWISLVCMILWLGTFILGMGRCIQARKGMRRADQASADETERGVENIHDEKQAYKVLDDSGSEADMGDEGDRKSMSKAFKGEKDPVKY